MTPGNSRPWRAMWLESGRWDGQRALAAVLCAWLWACAADGVPSSDVTQRDSAGVTIVESAAPRWDEGDAWVVDPQPVLDLSETGDGIPHEFFNVSDALRLADGSIAVAMSRAGEIRFFTPQGAFVGAVGRQGEGPGEFLWLIDLARHGADSILAFDRRAQRVTVVDPAREIARVIPLPLPLPAVVQPLGGDGLVAVMRSLGTEPVVRDNHVRQPAPVVRFSWSGEVIDTLATTLGAESVMLEVTGGLADALPFFGRTVHLATRSDRIYLGTAEGLEYRVLGPAGDLERVVRVPDYDLSVSVADIEAEKAARLAVNDSRGQQELLAALPVPEARPGYSALAVDAVGFVWTARHDGWFVNRLGGEAREWEVFDPQGAWLGTVRLPPRFEAFDIGADYVLGLTRDDVDVERVQLLRLQR